MPDNVARALLGDQARGCVWRSGNGLILHRAYAHMWQSGAIAIIPAAEDQGELEVHVLDPAAVTRYHSRFVGLPDADALDGTRLQFRGDFRPVRRHLWLRLAATMLHRHRWEAPAGTVCPTVPERATVLWKAPGSHLTRPVLVEMARQIGGLTTAQAEQFWGMTPGQGGWRAGDHVVETLAMDFHLALRVGVRHDDEDQGPGGSEDIMRTLWVGSVVGGGSEDEDLMNTWVGGGGEDQDQDQDLMGGAWGF